MDLEWDLEKNSFDLNIYWSYIQVRKTAVVK